MPPSGGPKWPRLLMAQMRSADRRGMFGVKAEDIYSGRVFRILTRCYGATQAGNPGVRRFLDRLRISVVNGNKNWLSDQPSQVVKWIADLFPLFAGVV
jgi:hypothetical protein